MPFSPNNGNSNTLVTIEGYSLGSTTGVYFKSETTRVSATILEKSTRRVLVYPPSDLHGETQIEIYTEYGQATAQNLFRFIDPPSVHNLKIENNKLILEGQFDDCQLYINETIHATFTDTIYTLDLSIINLLDKIVIQNNAGILHLNTLLGQFGIVYLDHNQPVASLTHDPLTILNIKSNTVYYFVAARDIQLVPNGQIITRNNHKINLKTNETIIGVGLPNNLITFAN